MSLGLLDLFVGGRIALVDMGQQVCDPAEQFRPTLMAARVHEALALVDQIEVKSCDHCAFAGTYGFTHQFPLCEKRRPAPISF